jgi:hypothetical protein
MRNLLLGLAVLLLPAIGRAETREYICTVGRPAKSVVEFELTSAPLCGGAPAGVVRLCASGHARGCTASLEGNAAQWFRSGLRAALAGVPFGHFSEELFLQAQGL